MTDRPLSRRQFLGAAAAAAGVAPSSALGPSDPSLGAPTPSPVLLPPESLPPGVARQFGSGRFRVVPGRHGRFSADGRWWIVYGEYECWGYEMPTARRFAFRTPSEPGWATTHWLPTTDGRLTAIEANDGKTRVRQFRLPEGTEALPPVVIRNGEAKAVSADGRVVVVDGLLTAEGGCWGLRLGTDRRVWRNEVDSQPHPLDQTGRFGTVGAFVNQGVANAHPKLIDLATGRRVKLTPAADDLFLSVAEESAVVSADGSRLLAGVRQAERNWRQRFVIWDTASGRVVGSVPRGESDTPFDPTFAIGLTADGKGWFGVDGEERQLVVRDVAGGNVTRRLPVYDVDVSASAVCPDGKTLVVGRQERGEKYHPPSTDNTLVRLIDADTGSVLPPSPDPPGPITRVWFPTRNTTAAAYRTRVGHLDYVRWDNTTGRGRRFTDPTDRNEPARTGDPDPLPLASPDLTHFLRPEGGQLAVVNGSSRRVVARLDPPPTANGRWFWLYATTVGVFGNDGLHLWDWAAGTTTVVPLALPGKWPHVWRWRASADGRTVAVQFFPNLTGRACQVGWVDLPTGRVTVSGAVSNASGEGFTAATDGGRVAALLGKEAFHVFDRSGWQGVFRVPNVVPRFDLTACGRTLAVQCDTFADDEGERFPAALEWWETASGQRRWRQAVDRTFDDLRSSPCGRFVATGRADQPVSLWDVYGETSDPQPEPRAAEWPQLWAALGSADAEVAFRAVRRLVQHPAAAVKLVSTKLRPAVAPDRRWVDERLALLGDRDYRTRQAAEAELTAVADLIADHLLAAVEAGVETEEAADRLERVATRRNTPGGHLRTVRAVEVLEYAGEAAGPLLARLANGAPGFVSREATAAVKRSARLSEAE